MTDTRETRRTVLRAGGAGLGALVAGGLAGCSSLPGGDVLGGGGNYANWLPDPDEFDRDHYSFTWLDSSTIASNEDELDNYDAIEGSFSQFLDPVDLDFDETNTILSFQANAVVTGDYDAGDVEDELDDNDYDDETDHEGYTIYLGPNEGRAVAVSGSNLVFTTASGSDSPDEVAELLIDTNNGDEDRYVDEEEDFQELTNQLGSATVVSGSTSEAGGQILEDTVAFGSTISINGDTSDVSVVLVLDDADDYDEDDVEDVVELFEDNTDVEDISSSTNGRSVVISGTLDTDELGQAGVGVGGVF